MDKSQMEYRKAELSGLKDYVGQYNLKVVGFEGTESKWLSITEEELADIRGILTGDTVNTALHMLANAGFIAKVYGPEDVHEALYQYVADNNVDALTYRDEITQHIVEGDDWEGILDTENGMDYIWGMIDGTRNDHPEWFPADREAHAVTPEDEVAYRNAASLFEAPEDVDLDRSEYARGVVEMLEMRVTQEEKEDVAEILASYVGR